MAWNVVEEHTERVEDTNPDVWLRASEESLKNGNIDEALCKIDKAIRYSDEDTHYVLEKVKVLYAIGRYDECLGIISSKMQDFQKDFKGNNKLNKLFDYYSKSIEQSSQGGQNLYNSLMTLYNNGVYEEFLDLTEKKVDILRNTVDTSAFNNLINNFLRALMNIESKGFDYYLNKAILLYKLGFYEEFLSFILNKLSENFASGSKNVLKFLLNYVNDALGYVNNDKKYYFIKIKLLFYCDMYDECANEICRNINKFDYNQVSYAANYLKDCIINNKKDNMNLFTKTLVLFNIDKFETFLEVIKIKIVRFKNNLSKEEFNELIDYVHKAILKGKNLVSKEICNYAFILYKYNKIEEFIDILRNKKDLYTLETVEKNIDTYKKELNKEQWDKLLDCFYENILLNDEINSLSKNKIYNKMKLLFNWDRCDQFLDLFYYKNNYDFIDLIYDDIEIYKNKFNNEQFKRLLEYVYKKIKDSDEDVRILYKKIKEFFEYIGFEKMLQLFKYKNYNFGPYIKEDIEFFKENLDEESFDKLLNYFYNATKSFASRNSDYKFECIKTLYNYGKFNECIELFKDNINLFLRDFTTQKYNEAMKYFRKSYFESGKILSGLAFCIISPIKYRKKRTTIQVTVLLLILVGYKFNVIHNIGSLGSKTDRVETTPNKEIMDKNEVASENYTSSDKTDYMQDDDSHKSQYEDNDNDNYNNYNSDDVFPKSSFQKLRGEDMYSLSIDSLWFGRNEIFARHGYVFTNRGLQQYFENKSWYHPNPDFTGSFEELNEIEEYNAELIKEIEEIKMAYEQYGGAVNMDYILPNSSSEKLYVQEVENLNLWELIIARNEVFARYGFVFGIPELKSHFESKSWYQSNYSFSGHIQNDIEDYNISLIKQVEQQKLEEMFKRYHGE